jgi:hypothetical protein
MGMTTIDLIYEGRDLRPRAPRAIARATDPTLPVSLSTSERASAFLRRVDAGDSMAEFWPRRCHTVELHGRG